MPKDKRGYDNALVIVDRFSKAAWTIPCTREATAKDAAQMYYNGPFRVHGYPDSVITDRGPQFISDFTDEFSRLTGQTWKLSSAGHSQTAGQAEIMNAYLNQQLRPFVNQFQDD